MISSPITDEELQLALAGRTIVGQAMGILMERYKITGDDAFSVLLVVSQNTNRKLYLVASQVVDSGEWPPAR